MVASLATRHGKRVALGPPLRRHLGLRLRVPEVDTDALGTFTGEIERPGPAEQVVVAKARLGMAAAGCAVGVASEGSFGPHPSLPWCSLQVEYVALVDDRLGLVVRERATSLASNHAELLTDGRDRGELLQFARRTGLPGHAVTVAPAVPVPGAAPVKGIVRVPALLAAVAAAATASPDGRARVAADLRAHHNPRRMAVIAEAGRRLARRVATPCPDCATPGFGLVATHPGLPCAACGTPTDLVAERVSGCGSCGYRRVEPVRPGAADPGVCPHCNP
ncbi:hypothetical protein GA0070611_1058 [Micromonospora auratinigra]|uniref:DUF6671 domain-containing protein n=1 Tax=Micromonospora auratinigra TaxID=261654 RepID=A0A1A8Z7N2_9ACTN|nr:hypothetical protein GA0070611_1058 [Micromonospora auratinigra]